MGIVPRKYAPGIALILTALLIFTSQLLTAGGTPELRSASGDPVMLLIGDERFGSFAGYSGPENSRLNFRIAEAGEVVYLGLSRLYDGSGGPQNRGSYRYRIRSAASGAVVFGPQTVDNRRENLSTYEQAVAGPRVLGNPAGYEVGSRSTFIAPAAGEYYIEFETASNGRPRYIGLWDVTVVRDGVEQTGRLYSRNWAFRVPEREPEPPYCSFGAELSTVFYSYTVDGFVTMIDFTDSGFQPLSFNLAFNRTGPGSSGDLALDRRSVANQNLTNNSAEHLIFLEEPDVALFPDGACGSAQLTGELRCQAENTFCIPITASMPGQVEVILDFNQNGRFDDETDRLLVYNFTAGEGNEVCIPWDGLRPDGTRPPNGTVVDILVNYTQGVQHWACYDGELMRNGFCVRPVRPICNAGEFAALHYDDSAIPEDPGTGTPKRVLDGCDCSSGCRTWTNFEVNAEGSCRINNDLTTGYGDKNTLNTWWFASSTTSARLDVPLEVATVAGPADHCPGEPVSLELSYSNEDRVSAIRWSGPGGPLTALNGQSEVTVTESGNYTVEIADEFGCTSSATYALMDVACSLTATIVSVICDNNGTAADPLDDTYTAEVRIDGGNSPAWFSPDGTLAGNYGEVITIGPLPITEGDYLLTVTDGFYDCCTETIPIMAPRACSEGCAVTDVRVGNVRCSDRGTDDDPSDDVFYFEATMEGFNLSSTWTSETGQTGSYSQPTVFGPFPISAGSITVQIRDSQDPECTFSIFVDAPMSCSDRCVLEPTPTEVACDDNGTPYDATDDLYTFQLTVEKRNLSSTAYQIDGQGLYLYGQAYEIGPLPIAGADFTFTINAIGGTCDETFTLAEPPTGCSEACGLRITSAEIICQDNGTENRNDDGYSVEVMVENLNPNATSWTTDDGRTGSYGETTNLGVIQAAGGEFFVVISDQNSPGCTDTVLLRTELPAINCVDDVTALDREVTLLNFPGQLTGNGTTMRADVDVCWMADENYSTGRRNTQRFGIARENPGSRDRALYTFYLYAGVDSELRGAVFTQMTDEELDCCHLTNEAPVSSRPSQLNSAPVLPQGVTPAGLELQQVFSVALRKHEKYSLITSSRRPAQTGDYQWLILTADGESLSVVDPNARDPEVDTTVATIPFDLTIGERTALMARPGTGVFGTPTVDSNCLVPQFVFVDSLSQDCQGDKVTRSFDLTIGDTTLVGACSQEITFRRSALGDVIWPDGFLSFGCGDSLPTLDDDSPDPAFTGFPFLYRSGEALELRPNALEGLDASYVDVRSSNTDGSVELRRTWTVTSTCEDGDLMMTQLIKIGSNGVPFFSCPVSNHYCPIVEEDIMLFTTNQFDCFADIEIPDPQINNVCDSASWTFLTTVLKIEMNGDTTPVDTLVNGQDRTLTGVLPGDYLLRYIGRHEQEEIEDQLCRFRVADLTAPNAICKSKIEVSMPGNGRFRLTARVLDQGSYDNCAIASYEIRRELPMNMLRTDGMPLTQWDDAVFFDCADVGVTYMLYLRVTDTDGNENFCESSIVVVDNTDPYCTNLDDVTIDCDSMPNNFSAYDTVQLQALFGLPDVVDNCSAEAFELEPIVTGDDCMPSRIRRRFRALDQHGNFSAGTFTQDVTIITNRNYAIGFPMDASTDCTDLVDTVVLVGAGCDSLIVTFVDTELPVEGEECRFLARTFTVTNFCEWDGASPALEIGRDEECDGTDGNAVVWLVSNPAGRFLDTDSDATNQTPAAGSRRARCTPNPAGYLEIAEGTAGRYTYTQRLKIFDSTAPVVELQLPDTICVDTSACRANVDLAFTTLDACQVSEGEVTIRIDVDNDGTIDETSASVGELMGSFPNYVFSTSYPLGTHRLEFVVTDDCDNTSVTEQLLVVQDCYVPVLICRSERIYDLEQVVEEGDVDGDGKIEVAAVLVDATDLASCDFQDCSGDLTFSINRVGEPYDRDQETLVLDCEDRYEVMVEVYVWDESNSPDRVQPDGSLGGANWRRCIVRVRVQDPNLVCNNCQVDGNLTLNGRVNDQYGQPMDGVTITDGAAARTLTTAFGGYQLAGQIGGEFTLMASKSSDPRVGISTLDLVLLRFHLLGKRKIIDPYLLLAADVNRNGELEVGDMIMLQAMVLARKEIYAGAEPWLFVRADWDGNGTPLTTYAINGAEDCSYGHDFVGIRMGDLDGSLAKDGNVGADAGAGVATKASGNRPLRLELADKAFVPGETFTTVVTLPAAGAVSGGQFALEVDGDYLALRSAESGGLNAKSDLRVRAGSLWASWATPVEQPQLVVLTFGARLAGTLSEVVHLSNDTGSPISEAYDLEATAATPLLLDWVMADAVAETAAGVLPVDPEMGLLGVLPNPVRHRASIGIVAASTQEARLVVTDINGRVVVDRVVEVSAGEQWLPVEAGDWAVGVYGFTVELTEGVVWGRLVRQ